MKTLLPVPEFLALEKITYTEDHIILHAQTTRSCVSCPDCQQPTNRVHSRYTRKAGDLPWEGLCVRWQLKTRKFFCLNPACTRRIFCERLPECLEKYAHRTARLNQMLASLAFALGGEAGAKLAVQLGHQVSPATLIERMRRAPIATTRATTVKVLGVDDFALRRGTVYGTILVDLETHQVVDLLEGREAQPLAEWLRLHPSITTISRDRAPAYQEGATSGAPQAQQVADRWHLLKNLTTAWEQYLHQQASTIKTHWQQVYAAELQPTIVAPPPPVEQIVPATASEYVRSRACQERRQRWHQERKAQYEKVQELKAAGYNIGHIRRLLGMSYSAVRTLFVASEYPVIQRRAHGSELAPFFAYLQQRWEAGCQNSQQLHREVMAQGYQGSRVTVWRYIYPWRKAAAAQIGLPSTAPRIQPPRQQIPKAQESVWLLLKAESRLTEEEKTRREQLLQVETVKRSWELVQEFRKLLASRKGEELERWMQQAEATEGAPFKGFLSGVRRDLAAVQNAFRLSWSNGQTEGQVNRLKFLKRQMFGRAKFDLLRARVLQYP